MFRKHSRSQLRKPLILPIYLERVRLFQNHMVLTWVWSVRQVRARESRLGQWNTLF